jgi:ATP-dependent DNA helicase RecQ
MMRGPSEVNKREIERILRALRRTKRNKFGEIVVTSDELLRDKDLSDLHGERKETRETKVKTAIAWLERAGFPSRNENMTEVFQGQPVVKDLDEVRRIIGTLNLHEFVAGLWLNILRILFNRPQDRGLSADSIAEGLFPNREMLQQVEKAWKLTPAQIVIHALHDMAEAHLIDRCSMLAAILRPKGKNNAIQVLQAVSALEERLIALMQAEDPDADDGRWVELDVRRVAQGLKSDGSETTPFVIRTLIKGLSLDGKGLAAGLGSLELQHLGRDRYQVRLQRKWGAIKKTARLRREILYVILKALVQKAERLKLDQQIHVASNPCFPTRNRTEQADILNPIALQHPVYPPEALRRRLSKVTNSPPVFRASQR